MNCPKIKDKFPDYLIGDLEETGDALEVQAHLTDCSDCRGELESLSETWT